jgi:hypothetical protein
VLPYIIAFWASFASPASRKVVAAIALRCEIEGEGVLFLVGFSPSSSEW